MNTTFRPTHRITLNSGETLEVMLVDGAAYQQCEWDANADADYERTDDGRWLFQGQPFAGCVVDAGIEREYRIAFARNDGSWDVVETFSAVDDDAANAYAEEHHADQDWYVLDAGGRNINGGRDQ